MGRVPQFAAALRACDCGGLHSAAGQPGKGEATSRGLVEHSNEGVLKVLAIADGLVQARHSWTA
jgi:hypothetical protein